MIEMSVNLHDIARASVMVTIALMPLYFYLKLSNFLASTHLAALDLFFDHRDRVLAKTTDDRTIEFIGRMEDGLDSRWEALRLTRALFRAPAKDSRIQDWIQAASQGGYAEDLMFCALNYCICIAYDAPITGLLLRLAHRDLIRQAKETEKAVPLAKSEARQLMEGVYRFA